MTKEGDVMWNKDGIGDLWLCIEKDGQLYYQLINDGETIPIDEPIGFVKVGHIEND